MKTKMLSAELLHNLDAYWRANIKHIQLGHWGTMPGLNFINVQKCDGRYAGQV